MSYSIIAKGMIKRCRLYWNGCGGLFYIKRRNLCISGSVLYRKMQEQLFKWSWKRTHSLTGSHRVNIWSSCGLISVCITWIECIKWNMGECKIKLANTTKAKMQRCLHLLLSQNLWFFWYITKVLKKVFKVSSSLQINQWIRVK